MDKNGNVKEEDRYFVLHILILNCAYLKGEKMAIEVLLYNLSSKWPNNQTISLLVSPEYHRELVSECLEYAWGLSKKFFRNKDFEEKTTTKFEK